MKAVLFILCMCLLGLPAWAETIRLWDGAELENVKVLERGNDWFRLRHSAGSGIYRLREIHPDERERLQELPLHTSVEKYQVIEARGTPAYSAAEHDVFIHPPIPGITDTFPVYVTNVRGIIHKRKRVLDSRPASSTTRDFGRAKRVGQRRPPPTIESHSHTIRFSVRNLTKESVRVRAGSGRYPLWGKTIELDAGEYREGVEFQSTGRGDLFIRVGPDVRTYPVTYR